MHPRTLLASDEPLAFASVAAIEAVLLLVAVWRVYGEDGDGEEYLPGYCLSSNRAHDWG